MCCLQVYIWDLKDPSKPYTPTPGARSTKLDEITSVAWNQQVQYVLAGASSTGYTVVWDLRGKREVVALAYGGGAGTLAGQAGSGTGMAVGGRRGMSDIAWHPDNVKLSHLTPDYISLTFLNRLRELSLLLKTIHLLSSWSGIFEMLVHQRRYVAPPPSLGITHFCV